MHCFNPNEMFPRGCSFAADNEFAVSIEKPTGFNDVMINGFGKIEILFLFLN